MSTIYTRAGKGSALTWTEGDANITNLNNDKIEDIVEDTTPQLGGNLDVNGNAIVSASNGDIAITPNGTGAVIIDGNEFPQTQGASGEVLTADGSGLVEWKLPGAIVSQVYNADSVTLTKGMPVYVFGSNGSIISVKRAVNTGDATSAQTLGLVESDITAGSTGNVVCQGVLKGYNTTGLTEGSAIYLGSTAGTFTQTKPYAPNHLVYLGFVETAGSNGRIYVRTQNGYELDEIHDVNINHNVSIANKDYLVYNSSNSLWENRQLDIVNDTTPQLGGDLDVNGNKIVSASNGNIAIEPNGTGIVTANKNIETTADVKAKELHSTNSSGDEGGQINLAQAATNSTLGGDTVTVDIWQNRFRIFEQGGDARGVYIDLSAAAAGVGTNLLSGGGGATSLDGLSDVTITGTPSVGQILRYTGNNVFENVAAGYLAAVGGDSSPQLGGNLNVNGNSIVSASNGNIAITPNGTGSIVLDGQNWPQADGTSNQVLKTDGAGNLSWTTISSGGISNVVEDTTPQLGGDLDVQDFKLTSTGATGDITIKAKTVSNNINLDANNLYIGNATTGTSMFVTTANNKDLTIETYGGASLILRRSANGNVELSPTGTGKVLLGSLSFPSSDGSANAILKTDGSGNLSLTNTIKAYNEGSIYDLGTTGGTVAPNVANGNVQKITLNSALTLNAFTSPVAGQSLTLIIYGGTSYTSITSTMKFAGGVKTLTATAGCIDIVSIYYDGTTYFASLGKGFA